jgi:two-component system OmpR family sensor kinase
LTVSNDGPSLPPDRLDLLMQRFQKGSPDSEGTGLGLAIVNAIVERSGARLTLMSPSPGQDQGVTVQVALPRD